MGIFGTILDKFYGSILLLSMFSDVLSKVLILWLLVLMATVLLLGMFSKSKSTLGIVSVLNAFMFIVIVSLMFGIFQTISSIRESKQEMCEYIGYNTYYVLEIPGKLDRDACVNRINLGGVESYPNPNLVSIHMTTYRQRESDCILVLYLNASADPYNVCRGE